jgi:hypothetical protein
VTTPLTDLDPPTSRRTSTAVTVGFAAVLCAAGLFLALQALTAGGGDGGAQPSPGAARDASAGAAPAPAPAASAPGATQQPAPDQVAFSSPTGNIGCVLSSAGARCDIADRSWQPPAKPETCTLSWGQGLVVGPGGTAFVCAGDSALGAAQKLDYGKDIQRGEYRCLSSQDGIRCSGGPSGAGFNISRGSYEIL